MKLGAPPCPRSPPEKPLGNRKRTALLKQMGHRELFLSFSETYSFLHSLEVGFGRSSYQMTQRGAIQNTSPHNEYPSRCSGPGHQLSPSFLLLQAADFKVPGDDGSMLSKLPGSHLPGLLFPSWLPTSLWFSGRKTARNKELFPIGKHLLLNYAELVLNSPFLFLFVCFY